MGTARDSSIDFGLVMHCNWCREPSNPADPNAVGVCDRGGNHLGYLKREVAEWFAQTGSGRVLFGLRVSAARRRHTHCGGL